MFLALARFNPNSLNLLQRISVYANATNKANIRIIRMSRRTQQTNKTIRINGRMSLKLRRT